MDSLAELRRLVPDDIRIHVAGRGTESLVGEPGVSVWGAVEGHEEDEFFSSIRVLVMPYEDRSRYGTIYSASGVLCRSLAYNTPVVVTGVRAFPGESDQRGVRTVEDLRSLAAGATELVRSRDACEDAESAIARLIHSRDAKSVGLALASLMRTSADS